MEELNRAWKKTSIVVLGDEVGELFEYVDWLGGAAEFMSDVPGRSFKSEARSALTGKKVYLFAPFYSSHARFVEMEKIPEIRIDPLSIDEIKDIDSIFEALKERWFYRASVVLGNSSHVEKSDSVLNSHFVLESQGVEDSSYVAYSTWIRDGSKYVFGSMGGPGFQFSIRNFYGAHLKRALEAYFFIDSSDLYYTHRMVNSSECMFSFNLYGEHYVIGNLRLPKERYFKIKAHLLEQMRDELKKEKKLPSLIELLNEGEEIEAPKVELKKAEEPFDFSVVNEGFKKTTKALLGREMDLKSLEDYLSQGRVVGSKTITTAFGNEGEKYDSIYFRLIKDESRFAMEHELPYARRLMLLEDEIKDFEVLKKKVGKIGVIVQELKVDCGNVKELVTGYKAHNCFRVYDVTEGKHQAYNYLGCPSSDYTYGSFFILHSSFVINSDVGTRLRRALECDRCSFSSDVYFCHNCGACQDVMFSMHLRGARYVIGNRRLERSSYSSIKASLLEQIADAMEKGNLKGVKAMNE